VSVWEESLLLKNGTVAARLFAARARLRRRLALLLTALSGHLFLVAGGMEERGRKFS